MILEPKHIIPYLPYKLKLYAGEYFLKNNLDVILDRLDVTTKTIDATNLEGNWFIDQVKPILKPLSNFQEEQIEEIKAFLNQKWCEVYDDFFDALFEHDWLMHTRILMCPYEILQWFFKNHYDVFGLIEDNLAIDINTLNK